MDIRSISPSLPVTARERLNLHGVWVLDDEVVGRIVQTVDEKQLCHKLESWQFFKGRIHELEDFQTILQSFPDGPVHCHTFGAEPGNFCTSPNPEDPHLIVAMWAAGTKLGLWLGSHDGPLTVGPAPNGLFEATTKELIARGYVFKEVSLPYGGATIMRRRFTYERKDGFNVAYLFSKARSEAALQ